MNTKFIDLYRYELENIPYSGKDDKYKNLYQQAKTEIERFNYTYMCIEYDKNNYSWSVYFCRHRSKSEVNDSLKHCKDIRYFKEVDWDDWLKYIGEI